jgi:hypothetical protein
MAHSPISMLIGHLVSNMQGGIMQACNQVRETLQKYLHLVILKLESERILFLLLLDSFLLL